MIRIAMGRSSAVVELQLKALGTSFINHINNKLIKSQKGIIPLKYLIYSLHIRWIRIGSHLHWDRVVLLWYSSGLWLCCLWNSTANLRRNGSWYHWWLLLWLWLTWVIHHLIALHHDLLLLLLIVLLLLQLLLLLKLQWLWLLKSTNISSISLACITTTAKWLVMLSNTRRSSSYRYNTVNGSRAVPLKETKYHLKYKICMYFFVYFYNC